MTRDLTAGERAILDRPCPTCGAPPGQRCTRPSGRLVAPHAPRWWAWYDQWRAHNGGER